MRGLRLGLGLSAGGGAAPPFSISFTGLLTDSLGAYAAPGSHASVGYTITPDLTTETVKWSNSANPADAATYGTGASPTDFTASDGATVYLHVTDDPVDDPDLGPITRTFSFGVRYAPGSVSESALADWTIDDDVLNVNLASDFTTTNLTGTYVITGLPSGAVDDGDGTISGTADGAPETASITATFTDQYGRTIVGSYSVDTVYRTQATGGADLDLAFPEDSAITATDLLANWTTNGNTLTFVSVSPALPTGLSIASNGTMTGTPTTITADATYTLTMQDEYGRQTSDTFTLEIPEAPALVLIIGQSNAVGWDDFDDGASHADNVVQWNQAGSEAAVGDRTLDHVGASALFMGLDIEFSRSFRAANGSRKLVFIPAAQGTTSFAGNHWNKGDTNYEAAVSRANAAIANYGVGLYAILWHQGESDAVATSGSAYAAALDAMIINMRADITEASSVPFVVGKIGAFLDPGGYPNAGAINTQLGAIRDRILFTACVETSDLTDNGGGIHFDAASLRTMGTRYYSALATAQTGLAPVLSTAPTISGVAETGQVLDANSGTVAPKPVTNTWQWERGGTPISGATSSSYTIVEADEGSTLTVVQTVTNVIGSDSDESAPTDTVVAPSASSAIQLAVEASTSDAFWAPTDDTSIMAAEANGTGTVTSSGDPVGLITSPYGNINLNSTGTGRPAFDSTTGLLNILSPDPTSRMTATFSNLGSNMYCAFVIKTGTGTFYCMGVSSAIYAGLALNGNTSAVVLSAGSPTIKINGTTLSPANRDTFHDAVTTNTKLIVEFIGLDLTTGWETTVAFGAQLASGGHVPGSIGDWVFCDTPSASLQDDIRAELAARHGITL